MGSPAVPSLSWSIAIPAGVSISGPIENVYVPGSVCSSISMVKIFVAGEVIPVTLTFPEGPASIISSVVNVSAWTSWLKVIVICDTKTDWLASGE